LNLSPLLIPEAYRYERKFHVRSENENMVYISIKKHPAVFSSAFSSRYINNIYLDTNDYSHYWDNVAGLAKRIKVRIRWYGECFGAINTPVLEFKIKDNQLGGKVSFPLAHINVDSSLSIEQIHERFKLLPIPAPLIDYLLTLRMSLMNRYRREYFISQNGDFRFTVDSELSFTKLYNSDKNSFHKIKYPYSKILELKYDSCLDNEASMIASNTPFRVTRSSKYVFGMQLLKIL